MRVMQWFLGSLVVACFAAPSALLAAPKNEGAKLPVEIHSDALDVFQNENKAIFKGNVIAKQGDKTMRSAVMTVFYRDTGAKPAPVDSVEGVKAAASAPVTQGEGIYRIEAEGSVVFTTPEETAIGERAIYDVDADTIDLTGGNVTLTRGQNVLKGNRVIHNMTSNRSILTAGNGPGGKPARVHGLFVPESKKPKADEQ
jgi:lipopolysaccharide export system protein LptA